MNTMSLGKALISTASRPLALIVAVLVMALLPMLIVSATATETPPLPHSPVPQINRELLLGFLADNSTLTLIDARSPEEFAELHLPGAINVPFDALDANAELLPEDTAKPIVIYCRTGTRAGLLKEQLIAKGYADVHILPREQMHWQDDFMVFNCSTESATTAAAPSVQSDTTDE